jgi:hypothetical protein
MPSNIPPCITLKSDRSNIEFFFFFLLSRTLQHIQKPRIFFGFVLAQLLNTSHILFFLLSFFFSLPFSACTGAYAITSRQCLLTIFYFFLSLSDYICKAYPFIMTFIKLLKTPHHVYIGIAIIKEIRPPDKYST